MTLREVELYESTRAATRGDAHVYRNLLRQLAPICARSRGRHSCAMASVEDVEDIVQETLLAMHLKRHTWIEDKPLLPWVRAISRNKLLGIICGDRGEASNIFPIDEFSDLLLPMQPLSVASRPGRRCCHRQTQRPATRCCGAISVEGESAREVAERLGMTEGAGSRRAASSVALLKGDAKRRSHEDR